MAEKLNLVGSEIGVNIIDLVKICAIDHMHQCRESIDHVCNFKCSTPCSNLQSLTK